MSGSHTWCSSSARHEVEEAGEGGDGASLLEPVAPGSEREAGREASVCSERPAE